MKIIIFLAFFVVFGSCYNVVGEFYGLRTTTEDCFNYAKCYSGYVIQILYFTYLLIL